MSGKSGPAAFRGEEWSKGWTVVLAACAAAGIAAFHTQSIGSVMKTLQAEFGWTRTEITTGPFIISMTGLIVAPLTGMLVDRIGPRRVGLIAPWLFALALAFIGLTGPSIWTWYAAFAFIAVVSPAVTPLVWSTAIISRFSEQRGMALGVVIAGVAILGGFVPLLMTWGIGQLGWRMSYAMLGGIALIASVPLVWFFFHHADDLRRKGQDTQLPKFAVAVSSHETKPGLTLVQALKTSRYWRLLFVMVMAGSVAGFFIVHLQPLLTDAGISAQVAALTAAGIAPAIVVARLVTGYLLDRIFAPYLVAGILIMPIMACVLLSVLPPSVALGWIVAMLIGCSMGAEGDAIPFLVSKYFGQRSYAAIYGFTTAAFVFGYGGGPLVGAAVHDATQSYVPLMIIASVGLVLAAITVCTLGPYPDLNKNMVDGQEERPGVAAQPVRQT